MSSLMPWFLAAETGTTSTPNSRERVLMSMLPPEATTSSIMFSATTIGRCNSISCRVR